MKCDQIHEHLGRYVDGELAPAEQAQVEAHVVTCPHCTAEVQSLQELAAAICDCEPTGAPAGLWPAIESRMGKTERRILRFRISKAAGVAAAMLMALLGGYVLFNRGPGLAAPVQAETVDFSVLLDNLNTGPRAAFERFLTRYGAKPTTVADAKKHAPKLSFNIPEALPGGFRLEAVYELNFGGSPGAAARYERYAEPSERSGTGAGEFLGALFHQPILKEDFGTHRDYDCIVGQHRGHNVAIGEWRLVHLTDPTTCHCVLSRLDPDAQLPAVMAALAPRSRP